MALPDPQPLAVPLLSLNQTQILTALRSFLLRVVPSGTEIIRGQDNRVAEPIGNDFIVMTPLAQPRLGTNEVSYFDDVIVGSIHNTVLTVTEVDRAQIALAQGMLILDGTMNVAGGTLILGQLTGDPGGVGTYRITPSQNVVSEMMYVGTREDLVPTEFVVQMDVHGPLSGDNIRVIDGLFRSEYGVDTMAGFDVSPLYCTDPRQAPFVNDSNQIEYRWSMDAHLQVNPAIRTPQEFMTEIFVDPVIVAPILGSLPLTTSSGLHVQTSSGHQVFVRLGVTHLPLLTSSGLYVTTSSGLQVLVGVNTVG